MKILITGFTPFGGEKINPAYEAIKNIEIKNKNYEIIKKEIPTVFNKSIEELDRIIEQENPNIVICVGQAGGRSDITIERVAINVNDASIEDNIGQKPIDEKIFNDGENAYFATIPIKAITSSIKESNIPASVSNTAGTYVCNHLMYGLLYLINKKYPNIKGGFIHVPYIPEQVLNKADTPSMNLKDITKALEIAIEISVDFQEDLKISYGKTH